MDKILPNSKVSAKNTVTLRPCEQNFLLAVHSTTNISKYQELKQNRTSQSTLNQIFQCPLCHNILIDPVTDTCGHSFCGGCILDARKISNCCPVTLKAYETKEEFALNLVLNDLLQAELSCTNKSLGCSYVGSKRKLDHHVEEECKQTYLECPNKNCKRMFPRKDINKHIAECAYNAVVCNDCGWNGQLHEEEQHFKNCPEKEALCPFNCGKMIKRKASKKHLKKCPQKIMQSLTLENIGEGEKWDFNLDDKDEGKEYKEKKALLKAQIKKFDDMEDNWAYLLKESTKIKGDRFDEDLEENLRMNWNPVRSFQTPEKDNQEMQKGQPWNKIFNASNGRS